MESQMNEQTLEVLKPILEKAGMEPGEQYQICLDNGKIVTLTVQKNIKSEEEESNINKQISLIMANDEAVVNEPDLYSVDYGKDEL